MVYGKPRPTRWNSQSAHVPLIFMVIIHVSLVLRQYLVYATLVENATIQAKAMETAFVKWGGVVILVTYVLLHFKGHYVTHVRGDGPAKHVTGATRGTLGQTVMYVRKVGYRRQML